MYCASFLSFLNFYILEKKAEIVLSSLFCKNEDSNFNFNSKF